MNTEQWFRKHTEKLEGVWGLAASHFIDAVVIVEDNAELYRTNTKDKYLKCIRLNLHIKKMIMICLGRGIHKIFDILKKLPDIDDYEVKEKLYIGASLLMDVSKVPVFKCFNI